MKVLRKLLNGIRTYLKKPKPRILYAVTGGRYLGEFFLFMEQPTTTSYMFLSLPNLIIRTVSVSRYNYAVANKILDPIHKIPRNVYRLCKSQYKTTRNVINN